MQVKAPNSTTGQAAVANTTESNNPTRRETTGFDRLLGGVGLSSLDQGPVMELPLIHPMTGAAIAQYFLQPCRPTTLQQF